ncbi:MAG: VCBS repeat-containing protein [Paucibacter sp.]|nr:VCBS repeat-containing protein [Roseateles sp.]
MDLNGDGRQDIVRWGDDPAKNAVYLSTGDGTFTQASNLGGLSGVNLRRSDGSFDFIEGDFRGLGATELLRVSSTAHTDGSKPNLLLASDNTLPADQIIGSTAGNGLTTTVNYEPLTATPRYTNDRGTAQAAVYPMVDLSVPTWLVTSSVAANGVGAATVRTDYAYAGLKVDAKGRGLLGFREVKRSSPGPNGEPMTVSTQFRQDHPYIGVADKTETRPGSLTTNTAALSTTVNTYCYTDASAGQVSAAQANGMTCPYASPSPITPKIFKPYLARTVESGQDLAGNPLPTVSTVNTYDASGNLTAVVSTTTGRMTTAGLDQTFTKSVSNNYKADRTDCDGDNLTCRWQLGRLENASVTNTVPNSLGSLPTTPGGAPLASATVGTKPGGLPTKPIDPAVLSAILQLLLED